MHVETKSTWRCDVCNAEVTTDGGGTPVDWETCSLYISREDYAYPQYLVCKYCMGIHRDKEGYKQRSNKLEVFKFLFRKK